jgi:hypothetical protein
MLETFIENSTSGIKQIQSAYKKREWNGISETAHRLIPSFKHFSINVVVSDLIELKNISTEDPDEDRISLIIAKINNTTTKVLGELKNELIQ